MLQLLKQLASLPKSVIQTLLAFCVFCFGSFAHALDITPLTSELDGAKVGLTGVIAVIMVILGIILAFSYFKRGAK